MNLQELTTAQLEELGKKISAEVFFREQNGTFGIPANLLEDLRTELRELLALAAEPKAKQLRITGTLSFTIRRTLDGCVEYYADSEEPPDLVCLLGDAQHEISVADALSGDSQVGRELVAFPDLLEHLLAVREKNEKFMNRIETTAEHYGIDVQQLMGMVDPGSEWH